jgi:hypothetical protein
MSTIDLTANSNFAQFTLSANYYSLKYSQANSHKESDQQGTENTLKNQTIGHRMCQCILFNSKSKHHPEIKSSYQAILH